MRLHSNRLEYLRMRSLLQLGRKECCHRNRTSFYLESLQHLWNLWFWHWMASKSGLHSRATNDCAHNRVHAVLAYLLWCGARFSNRNPTFDFSSNMNPKYGQITSRLVQYDRHLSRGRLAKWLLEVWCRMHFSKYSSRSRVATRMI